MTPSTMPLLPEDLTIIQDVFDQSCQGFDIPKSSADAAALAIILVRQLQKGHRDKSVLQMIATNILTENL